MTDKILVVTAPDDILLSGIRILHVNLTQDQSQIVSKALLDYEGNYSLINYVWKMGDRVDWFLDKVAKSNLIIFNADSPVDPGSDLILGWTAAQPNSYYFGNLRDLHLANNHAIYSVEDILNLLENIKEKNAK